MNFITNSVSTFSIILAMNGCFFKNSDIFSPPYKGVANRAENVTTCDKKIR